MSAVTLPHKKRPCADCPFTKVSLKGWLGEARIRQCLGEGSFVCHKHADKSKQCAGHMLLLKEKNTFYALARRLDIDMSLSGREDVFDTVQDCIEHHKN